MKNYMNFVINFSVIIIICSILLPIIFLSFIYFMLYDRGLPIYTQTRIGKNGRSFKLYKIRTMKKDSDLIFEEKIKTNTNMANEIIKYSKIISVRDPRIAGWFPNALRRLSLDELPQIINVLKGDMAIVGPRPYMPIEAKKISPDDMKIITSVKPGITGMWQIRARSKSSFQARVKYDKFYVRQHSTNIDTWISLNTPMCILNISNSR